jgi:hypothetical protein
MVRESRKPTTREVKKELEGLKSDFEQFKRFMNVLFAEMDKCNMVLIRMLDKQGLLHHERCPHCDFAINTPLLDDIPVSEHCPACDKPLRETEQTTLAEEEEE